MRAITLVMEAARTSEMSEKIQLRTLQYIPEDSELQVIKVIFNTCFSNIVCYIGKFYFKGLF
jgi:hypothetical protein